ncbi:MAG: serine/threonine protein kinase [Xanthomonadales bacterium]|nr:serine/threonine protein kinase [Xanthomonadales bacterium]
MNADYARLRAAIEAAWELPAAARAQALAEALAGRPDLLPRAHRMLEEEATAERHFDALGARIGRDGEAALAQRLMHGRRFGAYRALRRLGVGGMGEVWLGERCDGQFQRQVAIKLLAPGVAEEWTAPRLAAERQILAGLDHPGIARLLDAGVDDLGQPYLIEEYVAGRPWGAVVGELPLRDRVRMVLRVCAAVGHAHARLVAHGDIKPANLLIATDGQPRLIDFGIARSLGTTDGNDAGGATPAYAAPEQLANGAATTAADIHALGRLLHECLCSGNQAQAAAARRECADLAAVVAQATRPDPAQRQASVALLAQDLERWLAHLPPASLPVSRWRRLRLFLRRHPWTSGAATLVLASWFALTVQIERQAQRIAAERDRATAVTDLLVDLYSAADPSRARGRETTLRELLDAAVARLAARALDSGTRAQLQRVLARSYQALGAHEAAQPLIDAALAHYRESPGDRRPLAEALVQAGENARLAAHLDLGQASFDEALALYAADAGVQSAAYLDTLAKRARLAILRGQPGSARGDLEAALAGTRALAPADPARVAERLNDLAAVDFAEGDFPAAERLLVEAVALRSAVAGAAAISPELATSLNNLGLALMQQGRTDAARTHLERALAQRRLLLPASHRDLAQTLTNLGVLLQGAGELDRAQALLAEALQIRSEALGEDHAQVAQARNNLALVLQDRGDLVAAAAAFRVARDTLRMHLQPSHPLIAQADHNLGLALLEAGNWSEAGALLRAALDARRGQLPAGHPHLAWSLVAVGRLHLAQGDVALARPLLEEAVDIRAELDEGDWLKLEARLALARARWLAGADTARPEARELAERLSTHPGSLGRQGHAALAELADR